jgi:hypothetical protein
LVATDVALTDLRQSDNGCMAADREQAAAQLASDLSDSQLDQLRHAVDTMAGRLHRLVEAAATEPRQRHDHKDHAAAAVDRLTAGWQPGSVGVGARYAVVDEMRSSPTPSACRPLCCAER